MNIYRQKNLDLVKFNSLDKEVLIVNSDKLIISTGHLFLRVGEWGILNGGNKRVFLRCPIL